MIKKLKSLLSTFKAKLLFVWKHFLIQNKKIKLPFLEGLSLYDVGKFFISGLYEGAVGTRAGSISFSFFMALFPAIIFLFTLIPFVPIDGFQQQIFELLREVLPPTSYELAESTINDILNIKRTDLLWITLITTIVFATNGTLSLLSNFSFTVHKIAFKNFWQQYVSALWLTIALSFLLIISVALVSLGQSFFDWVVMRGYLAPEAALLIQIGRTIVLLFTVLFAISLLFNFGPVKGKQWRFFSAGSIMATTLVIISSLAFSFYVTNFAQYNKLYGSIGTLLVLLLWIYINAIGLILGFELNMSIANAKSKMYEKQKMMAKL